MAFAPALLAPPSPEVQDQAAVANAIDPLTLGASKILPPPPLPDAASGLSTDALMKAAVTDFSGQLEPGNIDLTNRPHVVNPDGSTSTIRSLGVNIDGRETLIPTVSEDGRIMTDDEAIEQYKRTGRHLGQFDSVEASNNAADLLHQQQSSLIEQPGAPTGAAPAALTPEAVAAGNVAKTDALGREQVANAEAKATQDTEAAKQEAAFKAESEARRQKVLDRQETHMQAASAEVAAARAKAETEPFHSFWETRSIGQNIATGIGLVLGGVSWNANHVNRGVEMLDKAMALDLQLQKEKHADLWRAVNEAQEGVRTLDTQQLHELSAFAANEGAKHDALASRLASAAAMNKGKGDVTAAKKLAIEESEKANQFYTQSANAGATANHLREVEEAKKREDAEAARHHAEQEKTAALRAAKYKTKGGGGGGGGGAREQAAITLTQEIHDAKAAGKPMSQADIDRRAVALKIPLVGKANTINARSIAADAAKETAAAQKQDLADIRISEKDDARTVHWKGKDWLAPRANQVKDVAKDIANLEKYNDLIHEIAVDIDKNGFIIDPGGEDNPQTEKGKRRMSTMAELQALGRQISALQATDAGQKLEHQMIGHAGVGFKPGIASSATLRELGARANKLIDTKFTAMLTPRTKRGEGGGSAPDDEMRAAAERLTSGQSPGSDAAKAKAKAWLDAHPKEKITL